MEDWLYRLAGHIALAIELIAILAVAYGSAAALIGILRVMLAHGINRERDEARRRAHAEGKHA